MGGSSEVKSFITPNFKIIHNPTRYFQNILIIVYRNIHFWPQGYAFAVEFYFEEIFERHFEIPNSWKVFENAIWQISAPNGFVRCNFSVVPDSVFLFSENSQIFLWSFLEFFSNFNLFFQLLFCFTLFFIKIPLFSF